MRSIESNYLNMALTVQKIMKAHATEVATRKTLQAKAEQMNKSLEAIQRYQAETENSPEGTTEAKNNAARAAVELALILAGGAVEWAKEQNDAVRQAQFTVSLRTFSNVQGVVTVSRLTELAKHLKEVADKLKDWDVSIEEIKKLKELTELFNSQLSNPRELIVMRKSNNDMVHLEIGKLKKIIKSMDNLMLKFKDTKFLMEYETARIIIELGSRKKKKDDKGDNNEDKKEP